MRLEVYGYFCKDEPKAIMCLHVGLDLLPLLARLLPTGHYRAPLQQEAMPDPAENHLRWLGLPDLSSHPCATLIIARACPLGTARLSMLELRSDCHRGGAALRIRPQTDGGLRVAGRPPSS